MDLINTACPSCGAPVTVPPDAETVKCSYCGTTLAVGRNEGGVALKLISQLDQAIHETSSQVQSSIREGTQVTQVELRRLELTQQLTTAQVRLSTIQAEIRDIERRKQDRITKQQLKELHTQETALSTQIRELQAALAPSTGSRVVQTPVGTTGGKDWFTTLILCLFFGFFGIHRFYTGHILIGVIQLFTFGLAGIWWLLDLFLIVIGRYTDAQGNALSKPTGGRTSITSSMKRNLAVGFSILVLLCLCVTIATPSKTVDSSPTPTAGTKQAAVPSSTVAVKITPTQIPIIAVNTPRPTIGFTPQASPTLTITPQPTMTSLKVIGLRYVSADGDGLFIRSEPNMDAKVRLWPDGTQIELLSQDGDWCHVRDPDGYVGYMPAQYLVAVKPTPIPPRPTLQPQPQPVQPTAPSQQGGCAQGATAQCKDGTWSYSATHSGTCSYHGGVAFWCPGK